MMTQLNNTDPEKKLIEAIGNLSLSNDNKTILLGRYYALQAEEEIAKLQKGVNKYLQKMRMATTFQELEDQARNNLNHADQAKLAAYDQQMDYFKDQIDSNN